MTRRIRILHSDPVPFARRWLLEPTGEDFEAPVPQVFSLVVSGDIQPGTPVYAPRFSALVEVPIGIAKEAAQPGDLAWLTEEW